MKSIELHYSMETELSLAEAIKSSLSDPRFDDEGSSSGVLEIRAAMVQGPKTRRIIIQTALRLMEPTAEETKP